MSDVFNQGKRKQVIEDQLLPKSVKEARDRYLATLSTEKAEFEAPTTDNPFTYITPDPFVVDEIDIGGKKAPIDKFTAVLLDLHLKAYRIKVRKPVPIRVVTKVNVDGIINPEYIALLQHWQELDPLRASNHEQVFANVPFETIDTFIPRYFPSYNHSDIDEKVYRAIIYSYTMSDAFFTDPDNIEFMKTLVDVAMNTVYSSGTLPGQMNRLKLGWETKTGSDGTYATKSNLDALSAVGIGGGESDPATAYKVLSYYYPINPAYYYKCTDDQSSTAWPGLYKPPSYFMNLELDEDGQFKNENRPITSYLPDFYDTLAGVPYKQGDKKSREVLGIITMCDQFFNMLFLALKGFYDFKSGRLLTSNQMKKLTSPIAAERVKGLQKVLEDFSFMGTSFLVPKAERMNRKEVKDGTKSRNIMAISSPTYVFQALVQKPVTQYQANYLISSAPNLLHFSPFHGGMDILVNKILGERNHIFLPYADNLYLLFKEPDETFTWFSLDLTKGETQSQTMDARNINQYLLTHGHVNEKGRPMFSSTWAYLATNLLPAFSVDGTAVVGNVQVQVPGLASGVYSTHVTNHYKASTTAYAYLHMRDKDWHDIGVTKHPRPGSDGWNKLCRVLGVKWKIEREITDVKKKLTSLPDRVPLVGIMSSDTEDYSKTVFPSVDLDLLGWSVTYSNILKAYVPILAKERIIASVLYPNPSALKFLETQLKHVDAKKRGEFIRNLAKMVTNTAMMAVGGWAYGPMAWGLESYLKSLRFNHAKMMREFQIFSHEYVKLVESEVLFTSEFFHVLKESFSEEGEEGEAGKQLATIFASLMSSKLGNSELSTLFQPYEVEYDTGLVEDDEPVTRLVMSPFRPEYTSLCLDAYKAFEKLVREREIEDHPVFHESNMLNSVLSLKLDAMLFVDNIMYKFNELPTETKNKIKDTQFWADANAEFRTLVNFMFAPDMDLRFVHITTRDYETLLNPFVSYRRRIREDGTGTGGYASVTSGPASGATPLDSLAVKVKHSQYDQDFPVIVPLVNRLTAPRVMERVVSAKIQREVYIFNAIRVDYINNFERMKDRKKRAKLTAPIDLSYFVGGSDFVTGYALCFPLILFEMKMDRSKDTSNTQKFEALINKHQLRTMKDHPESMYAFYEEMKILTYLIEDCASGRQRGSLSDNLKRLMVSRKKEAFLLSKRLMGRAIDETSADADLYLATFFHFHNQTLYEMDTIGDDLQAYNSVFYEITKSLFDAIHTNMRGEFLEALQNVSISKDRDLKTVMKPGSAQADRAEIKSLKLVAFEILNASKVGDIKEYYEGLVKHRDLPWIKEYLAKGAPREIKLLFGKDLTNRKYLLDLVGYVEK